MDKDRRTPAEEHLLQSIAESFYCTGGGDIAEFVASVCAGNAELAEIYAKSPNMRGGEDTAPLLYEGECKTPQYHETCSEL